MKPVSGSSAGVHLSRGAKLTVKKFGAGDWGGEILAMGGGGKWLPLPPLNEALCSIVIRF